MAVKIQFRRDTAANWTAVATTVLSAGEVGYETDTGNIKIGDGTTQWGSLAYFQLANVSVNPATDFNLNSSAYRVMGRYRLNSISPGGTAFTNVPSDFNATVDADSVSTLIVTSHAYPSVSPTMIQQVLTQYLASNATLKQWVRLYNGTDYTAWTSTAHLTDNEVITSKIADDAVTAAKLADSASTDADRAVTTDHIRDLAVTTAKIADDAVTYAKMQDVAALSVIGVTGGAAANPGAITAGTDGHVLRRASSTSLAFGTIVNANIDASAEIALSKLATQATATIVGRVAAGTGVPSALTATNARTVLNVAAITEIHDNTKIGAMLMATKVGTGVPAPARGSIVGTGGTGIITYNAAGLNEYTISASGTHIGGGWTVCGSFVCDDNRYGVLMIRTA